MKNIYENIYGDERNLGNIAENDRVKNMLAIINRMNLEGKNILDVGCYDGTFLSLVKNRNNIFFGLEASDWGVRKSREKGIETKKYFFDGAELPHPDGFFDVVVAGEIIEHIFDTDFFLEEIARVLKSQGHLLISTPNLASFGRRLMLLFGKNPHVELSPNETDSSGHIRYFTFGTLRRLLGKHNFKIVISRSDRVNFSKSGRLKSRYLARIVSTFGASIICLARKRINRE